jgi:hypothetical protein
MLNVWTQLSGYSFGTLEPSTSVNLPLPVTNDSGVSYGVISGHLPDGLRIVGNTIVGTPFEVPRTTTFLFCIRASLNGSISDRSFKITVNQPYTPIFTTPAGLLPVGTDNAYFTLDSSFINFQLEATDSAVSAGRTLRYFISSGNGTLPPGLSLTDSGLITGYVQPAFAITSDSGDGAYDEGLYDSVAFDFGVRSDNGYDSFFYDDVLFDYSLPTNAPKKLDRNYEFTVTVSDGDATDKRTFRIYVVADTTMRTDNTIRHLGDGVITSDNTYLRAPIWVTPPNLGVHRANNYITLILDTYTAEDLGPITYSLDTTNPDNSPSVLPDGLAFDIGKSEVFGTLPYQPAITREYKFTVTATRYGLKNDKADSKRTFTITTLGEVESTMKWITTTDLGLVSANYSSNLKIEATTTVEGSAVLYRIISGRLPPGLTLQLDGEITGKINQYGDLTKFGMTTFSDGPYPNQTFDGGTTSIDRSFSFVARAEDQFGYSFITKLFTIKVDTPNDRLYSNIIAKTFMVQEKRAMFEDFINDSNIFTPSSIYRPADTNFGLQKDLKMSIYNGIETKVAAEYVSAIGLNHKRKRFTFGNVKSAKAKIPGTNTVVYEVIYVEMFDPLENNGSYLPQVVSGMSLDPETITDDYSNAIWRTGNTPEPYLPRPFDIISIDQTNIQVGDINYNNRYPSSISIWRNILKQMPGTGSERNYMPLWMRSIQDSTKQELGFVLAVPICYCKPGTSADILINIKYSGFDFKNLDYTVDRYIIDSVTGYSNDKYLVFKNDKVTIT